jgi:hypothetical protein
MATNLQLEVGAPTLSDSHLEGLRLLLRLIELQPDRVVTRFRFKILFMKPSIAVRLRHLKPFVLWLLSEPAVYTPPETPETPE